MNTQTRRWIILLAVIAAVLAFDQISKRLIVTSMELHESVKPIPALADVFRITRSYNMGAAFGFLPEAGDLFMILAVVVVVAMLIFFPRIPDNARLTRLAVGLVCGGALGNALDRVTYGHVVDFIHYRIPGVIDNVSNLADHAIVLGVLLILFENWRSERAEIRTRKAEQQAGQSLDVAAPDETHPGIPSQS
ncbi:MAG: signal peptidase II [bacterium]|nr:signal peptidase II [bacterium]